MTEPISYTVASFSGVDVLRGVGLYFRCNPQGRLIVFGADGLSVGIYEPGEWVSISTNRQAPPATEQKD